MRIPNGGEYCLIMEKIKAKLNIVELNLEKLQLNMGVQSIVIILHLQFLSHQSHLNPGNTGYSRTLAHYNSNCFDSNAVSSNNLQKTKRSNETPHTPKCKAAHIRTVGRVSECITFRRCNIRFLEALLKPFPTFLSEGCHGYCSGACSVQTRG